MPNKAKNVMSAIADQVVNADGSIVAVQYLPSLDEVYTLSAEEYADVVDLADDWFEGNKKYGEGKSMRADVAKGIKRSLGELPSYAKYMAFRSCFIQQLLSSGKTKNDVSAAQMWTELLDLVRDTCKPFTIPKSPKPNANRMATKREQDKKALQSMSDDELESALANYKATDNFTKCNLVNAELKSRAKKALESNPAYQKALEEMKSARSAIIEDVRKIKNMDHLKEIGRYIKGFV